MLLSFINIVYFAFALCLFVKQIYLKSRENDRANVDN